MTSPFLLFITPLTFAFSLIDSCEKETVEISITKKIIKKYPACTYQFDVKPQYRNMKSVLNKYPHVVNYALEAIKRSGIKPKRSSIRGGTDGSRLSFMGLPCPNIFAGEHAFHSKQEWISIQDMQKAVETIVNLCMVWCEKTKS